MRAFIRLFASLGVLTGLTGVAPAEPVTPVMERDARLRAAAAWAETQLDHNLVPGAAAAIVHDQTIVWSKGFGYAHLANKTPATPETAFSICSVSKLFTSTAIMQLVERGRVDLDAPLSRYVRWFKLGTPEGIDDDPITVRGALTHAAGLPREGGTPYWAEVDFPDEMTLRDKLKSQERLYTPFTTWQYSNLGMALLGEVVETVSRQPYDRYVTGSILEPLGLKGVTTDLPVDEMGERFAMGYGVLRKDGTREEIGAYTINAIAPAAGFGASATDLAGFASWQFRLMTSGKTEVLSRSTLRQMHRVHWADPNDPDSPMWGLGYSVWKKGSTVLVGHGGYCPGYRTQFMMRPQDKIAVITIVNVNDFSPRQMAYGLYDLTAKSVLKAAKSKKPKKKQTKPDAKKNGGLKPPVDFTVYEGTYAHPVFPSKTYVVPVKGGLISVDLYAEKPGERIVKLKHIKDDTFRRKRKEGGLGETIRFERDDSGRPVKVWRHNMYLTRTK